MVLVIASATTLSVAANAKSIDQITGTYQNLGKGRLTAAMRSSATGLNAQLLIGGQPVINDLPIPFFGSTGGLDNKSHVVVDQMINGGRCELFFRNTTGGALTVDYVVWFDGGK